MFDTATVDQRLTRLTSICLALPEATRRDDGQHARFLVRAKTFLYFLNDHHGDGIVSLCCRVASGENEALIAAEPARFYPAAYIGRWGWVSLRLDLSTVDWHEVAALVNESYRRAAPKRLAALIDHPPLSPTGIE